MDRKLFDQTYGPLVRVETESERAVIDRMMGILATIERAERRSMGDRRSAGQNHNTPK